MRGPRNTAATCLKNVSLLLSTHFLCTSNNIICVGIGNRTADDNNFSRENTSDPGWSDDEDDRASFLAKAILEDKKRATPFSPGKSLNNFVSISKIRDQFPLRLLLQEVRCFSRK